MRHFSAKTRLLGLLKCSDLAFTMLIIEIDTSLGANKDWLGKEMDQAILDEIAKRVKEKKINPIGEWGEYHTFVVDCPIYKKTNPRGKSKNRMERHQRLLHHQTSQATSPKSKRLYA